ncbi:hypothetical protein [Pseudomonas oryzihabitans]|uniref:hypothetical protein n=1 Tax=Pseudomonas oryzihabitans TaxID=47885 RepID=UPI00286603DB|nr:hypothetical protein [Pseudomonas psychrotolerans]MDR6680221.1 hypothetical protein [Pseudomonas psychrotolerans]
MATTSLSFRLGEAAGTVVRECMQSMRNAQSHAVEAAQSAAPTPALRVVEFPKPILSAEELEKMDHTPALVRLRGVNLNAWFAANTREAQPEKPKRVRKPRKPKAAAPAPEPVSPAPTRVLRPGSLDLLIAPVDPLDALAC